MRIVWIPLAAVAAAIAATYARTPVEQLYHVQDGGIAGGLGRAVVYLNWPVAFVALGALAVAADRLGRRGRLVALAAALLCAGAAWPGAVSEADLDVEWANAPAALGVALAVAVTFAAPGRSRLPGRPTLALGAVLLVAALPWLLADLGFSPHLRVFLTGELRTQPGDPVPRPAVHVGHHHGADGVLLALSALLLLPELPRMKGRVLGPLAAAWVSLLFGWGLANALNDGWLEQIVKRGWTTWEVPDATHPHASWLWALVVALAAALFVRVGASRTRL